MEKNDKARAVLVYQILRDESGEENSLSLKDIIGKIEKKGISAERRAVTRDIAMLREKGICRVCDDTDWRTKRYWYEERDPLTDTEMNIITDAIHASAFLDEKSSEKIISKIGRLAGRRVQQAMEKRRVEFNKTKHKNPSTLPNTTVINSAISNNHTLMFNYFKLDENGKRDYAHEKKYYEAEPIALIFNDDNYYLRAIDLTDATFTVKNFRVDRLENVSETLEEISARAKTERLGVASYTRRSFKMFGGDRYTAELHFTKDAVNYIYDQFGEKTPISKVRGKEGLYSATVEVESSPNFFAWLFTYGDKIDIAYPTVLRSEYQERVEEVLEMLKEKAK